MTRALLILTLAALTSLGCRKSDPVSPDGEGTLDPSALPATPLVIARLRAGPESFTYSSGIADARRTVIRDDAAWRTAWAEIWARTGPTPPAVPAIDFTRDMIVLAALGQRNSGGYGITVDSASRSASGSASGSAGGVVVWVTKLTPGNCGTTAALTQPVDLASMPKVDGSVTFREREAVSPGCM